MMKILHFNTYDAGGAACAVYRFHVTLKEAGHDSKILVFKKRSIEDPDIIPFQLSFFQQLRHYTNELRRKIARRNIKKEYNFFNVDERIGFPTNYFTENLPFKPDIICVHWVSGFMHAKNIYELSKITGAPVVWRFNDLNAFTGGCHYSNGCTNYHTGCGNCPALPHPSPKDRSWQNAQAKIKWLGKTNLCFVSSTTEIDEQLKSSAVAKVCKTRLIMLSCQSKNFKPADKKNAAIDLGLPSDRKIIFFGANDLSDPRKGFKELLQSLELLKLKLTKQEQQNILLVYASKAATMEVAWPFDHIQLPFLNGEDQLAKAYQAATVFVSPSIEDAGPMMLLESILCGTPAIAYSVGLAKDAILNNVTGFIVPPVDVDKFADSIKTVVQMPVEQYDSLSGQCRARAIELFKEERERQEYEQLFDELIKSKGND
jgi:glycosyltransferase involved in cell wall biosynthesis